MFYDTPPDRSKDTISNTFRLLRLFGRCVCMNEFNKASMAAAPVTMTSQLADASASPAPLKHEFDPESELTETLELILREDHTRIVDDTLYEKVLDWMLRCLNINAVHRKEDGETNQLTSKFPTDFTESEEIIRMIGKGLRQEESRVVAVMLKLCGHLCSHGDEAFNVIDADPLNALSTALKLTTHAEPRIRTAAYECLGLAAFFSEARLSGGDSQSEQHISYTENSEVTYTNADKKAPTSESIEWFVREERGLLECLASSLSDRSIYVQLQGRTLLVNLLNRCQDIQLLLSKMWQAGSPMHDEITRVLEDAPSFSYERKKAIADMTLAVCLAVDYSATPRHNGSDHRSDRGCAAFLENTALTRRVWTELSVDTDPRLRVLALDIAAACLARIRHGSLSTSVLISETPTCTAKCQESASLTHKGDAQQECDCTVDAVVSTLVLSVLPSSLKNSAFVHIPVRVAALQCSQGDESDLSRQLLRLASHSLCAELDAASHSSTPAHINPQPNITAGLAVFKLTDSVLSGICSPAQRRTNGQLCNEWLKEFRRTLSSAATCGDSDLAGNSLRMRREVMGMTADKKLVAAIVPPLIQHWCPKNGSMHSPTRTRTRAERAGSEPVRYPIRSREKRGRSICEWQHRLTTSLLASITGRNSKRLTIRHSRFVLRAASAIVAESCNSLADEYIPRICTSVLTMLEDPSLDTTLIKDTLLVTRAYLSRLCWCTCPQNGACECVCTHLPASLVGYEKEIVNTWSRLLYDPRWEVRDSVLECLHSTVRDAAADLDIAAEPANRTSQQRSVNNYDSPLYENKGLNNDHPKHRYADFVAALKATSVVQGVWRACTDRDAYVRSSSMRSMCDLLAFAPTRAILVDYFADNQTLCSNTTPRRNPISSQAVRKLNDVVSTVPKLTEEERERMLDAYFADDDSTPILPKMVPETNLDTDEAVVRHNHQDTETVGKVSRSCICTPPPKTRQALTTECDCENAGDIRLDQASACQSRAFLRVVRSVCKMAQTRIQTDPEASCRRAAVELLDGILSSYACSCTPDLTELAECLYRAGDNDPDTEVRTRVVHLMLSLIPVNALRHQIKRQNSPNTDGAHEFQNSDAHWQVTSRGGSLSSSQSSGNLPPHSMHAKCVSTRTRLFDLSKAFLLVKRFETEEPTVRQSVAHQLRRILQSDVFRKITKHAPNILNASAETLSPHDPAVVFKTGEFVELTPGEVEPSAGSTTGDKGVVNCARWLCNGSCSAALKREEVREELLLRDQISPLVIFKPVLDMQENAMDCYN